MPESEINALLAERIEPLVRELLPAVRKAGNELCIGSLAGEAGQSLRIHCGAGSKRGWYRDFSSGEGGDALKLVAQVLFGGDYKRAVPWAKSWLGLDDADPERFAQKRREAQAASARREVQAAAELERKRKQAVAIWQEARPLQRGDLVDKYLLARAIDLAELGHAPGVIRFHPALPYYIGRELRATLPAMVTQVNALDSGAHVATHRTWLKPDGSGKAGPDEIGTDERGRACDPKRVLGRYWEGHIKLWLGRDDAGNRIKGPLRTMPGDTLHLTEGIEDGLTVAVADPRLAVAAMITIGNMAAMPLPTQAQRIVMLRQNDAPGSAAARIYAQGVERLRGEGRRVLEVPLPGELKDINDLAIVAKRRGK